MELSKQGQSPMSTSMGSQSMPSTNIQSTQAEFPNAFYPSMPADWGAQPMFSVGASVPISSYYIVPMSQQAVQVGASRPETSHHSGVQSLSRVSLRPPQQVLNIQTSLPAMIGSQPSPPAAGKKLQQTVASPKVQMLKSTLSQSFNKRPAQKESPSKVQSQQLESVRSKFMESLAAALRMDSDLQIKKHSAENLQPDGSAEQKKQVEGDAVQATSKDVSTTTSEAVTANDSKKCEEDDKLGDDLVSNMATRMNDDMQQQSKHLSSEDEVLGQCTVVADELLQGHGLCWVSDFDAGISEPVAQANIKRGRTSVDLGVAESLTESDSKRMKSVHDAAVDNDSIIQKAEGLAFRIEEELFKLFGGVNKKYKEKGRSLLFNLKDKNNPELRVRVLSGDIAPERLCSMTAEELASKELSEWRLAKAEEFAQMVVLPNTEVDVRRLVRKTHKGEFQVEVEETDGISVEVELGGNLLSQVPSKPTEDETKSNDKTSTDGKTVVEGEEKTSDGTAQDEDGEKSDSNVSGDVEYIDNEKTDLMQELMVDDMKDAENLPPIPSLDEFMQGLDSEPPFENLSVGTPQDPSDCDEPDTTLDSEKLPETEDQVSAPEKIGSASDLPSSQGKCESKLESPKREVDSNLDPAEPCKAGLIKSSPDKVEAKQAAADALNPVSAPHIKATTIPMIRESIWEGAIQLTLSSLTNVVAIFKSGEKPPVKEWRSFVEIKGRVKLSAFQDFVEQLPKSRSRAIMITELCWKEGSLENGRQHLLQTIDSYIADERVGLAEPADGIELYLCPPQGKTVEILSRHLPKEHLESLTVAGTSIIGVIVWRRTNAPRIASHHRRDGSTRQSIQRKQQVTGSNLAPRPYMPQNSYGAPPGFPNQQHGHEEDVTDDVPPGFGPGVAARDEDDLPEFNFVNSSNPAANVTTQAYKGRQHVPTSARPVEQMRELVQKYGKRSSAHAHPWEDDDDDDIPEWNPNQQIRQQPPPPSRQQPLPQPPPVYQQQYHHPSAMQHQPQLPSSPLPQAYLRTQQPVQQLSLMQQQQPPPPAQTWQPNAWWPAQGAAAVAQQTQYAAMPSNNSVQGYGGTGNVAGMAWRPR